MNTYLIDLYGKQVRVHSYISHCADDDAAIDEASLCLDQRPNATMAIVDVCEGPGRFRSVATITENVLPIAVILGGETHGL